MITSFKVYFKMRKSLEVVERLASGISEKEGVVWLKNGGWLRIEDVYLTRERAEAHQFEERAGLSLMKPDNEK